MDVTRRVVPIARASQTATPRTGFEALLSIYLTTAPARGMLTANQLSLTRGLQGISQFVVFYTLRAFHLENLVLIDGQHHDRRGSRPTLFVNERLEGFATLGR